MMTDETGTDDLEGFEITGRDDATGTVTIAVHRYVLKHNSEALAERLVQLIADNPKIEALNVSVRPSALTSKSQT
nr:hypothetical protein [Bradyrhizobium sp. CCH1-B1]